MRGVEKRVLERGWGRKLKFCWGEEGRMVVEVRELRVGGMGLGMRLGCGRKFMEVKSWEKDE